MTTLAGIDVHVHVHDARARAMQGPEAVEKFEAKARYFKREARHTSVEEQAELYRGSSGAPVREEPEGPDMRLDSQCFEGYLVPPFYDSLLGKLITYGNDRSEALARMRTALHHFTVEGVATTIGFHQWLLRVW